MEIMHANIQKKKKVSNVYEIYFFVLKIVRDTYKLEIVGLGELVVSGILFCFEAWLVRYQNPNTKKIV